MSCLFCKIIDKEIPADIVYEDEHVLAFRDINPQAPHHLLVIPKKHIATINEADEADAEVIGRLSLTAAKLAKQLGFADSGYRTVMNCNEHGGQTVYHIHMHVLGGKAMGWPPYTDQLKQA
ncbi:histidine triad nucleotide-binding protein [Motiliproteus coralliicola]|uniref:Histidine triad nucleotide-binding protein n=1 Tax=Motiliproteus coralliicola TaxID=2283196 RepID=A0A369WNB6_9GAMM|nr:histidine triad nucleotide-binding protein [Motiliproteus coralliicola]RDE22713.1 histidine triad nucleotide-binding protein [Motiliproteus coralliicola]